MSFASYRDAHLRVLRTCTYVCTYFLLFLPHVTKCDVGIGLQLLGGDAVQGTEAPLPVNLVPHKMHHHGV